MAESIKVICRFRPQNSREKKEKAYMVVRVSDDHSMCEITHPDKTKQPKPVVFNFDCVFDWTSSQTETYEMSARHLVDQIFDGYNATIFAYGQTGAGKTYSMEGQIGSPHRGIVPRTVEQIFESIAQTENVDMEYLLQVSFVEIYLEQLRDLLKPNNGALKIRDSKTGVYIQGVTEMYVRDAQEVMQLMEMGSSTRTAAKTAMNAVSSRSHGVFMLKLTQTNSKNGSKKLSKLMMIDLAGSEKVSKTGASGQLLKEAQKINQSLSALGNVMSQLSEAKGHISFRDSVLTRLLSDSLGGNCKTTLLIACSPSSFNADETITTCRFGSRAKKIKNKAKINAEKTVAEYKVEVVELNLRIQQLQTLVNALQHDLELARKGEQTMDNMAETSKSEEFMQLVDMTFVMDDGKKKGKKKKKQKGYMKAGADLAAGFGKGFGNKKKKKKKKNDKKEELKDEVKDEDDDDDDTLSPTEEFVSVDAAKQIKDAEERADKAEQHIQYLEAELIKAQAAAATNSGLADAEPPPSPRKRVSILPAPHRPRTSLIPNTTIQSTVPSLANMARKSNNLGSNLLSVSEDNNDLSEIETTTLSLLTNSSSNKSIIQREMQFESETGDMAEQDHVIEVQKIIETQLEMPKHLADLDPALIEQARRILQQENYDLRKNMKQLLEELDQSQNTIQKKMDLVLAQKNKTEDAEMACDRLLLQHQGFEERIDALEEDRNRERQEIELFKNENKLQKNDIHALKQKLSAKDKEIQETIKDISAREAKRADDFIQEASRQFKRLRQQPQQNKNNNHFNQQQPPPQQQRSNNMRNGNLNQQQKELNRQRSVMEIQMQQLKQATFEQLEKIQLEQMKMKQLLSSKTEQCIQVQISLSDKNDEINQLERKIKSKDAQVARFGVELKAFGDLKLKSDQIHQKDYKKAQDTIYDLKKMLTKLKRMNNIGTQFGNKNNQFVSKQHKVGSIPQNVPQMNATISFQRQVMPIPIRGGGKVKNNRPISLKGGGGNRPQPLKGGGGGGGHSNNQHKPKSSQTSNFFNRMASTSMLPSPNRGPVRNNIHRQASYSPYGGGRAGGNPYHNNNNNNGYNNNGYSNTNHNNHNKQQSFGNNYHKRQQSKSRHNKNKTQNGYQNNGYRQQNGY